MHTTLLTQDQLIKIGVITTRTKPIRGTPALGWRATSYDAQVGTIITKKGIYRERSYSLKPREIVWVISDEIYSLPSHITGITTNKTTLTKSGILALTVGIVDPNYHGPLSTALINFSGSTFPIYLGMSFFRTSFFEHQEVNSPVVKFERDEYLQDVMGRKDLFSDTFLTTDTLSKEIEQNIFKIPRLLFILTAVGTFVAIITLLMSNIGFLLSSAASNRDAIETLRQEIERLQSDEGNR